MQSKKSTFPVDEKKKAIIVLLFIMAGAICASGAFFSVYSYINHITFQVINTQISGVIFGVVVFYLGIRYFLSLYNLKNELYKPTSRFSWDNFKKAKRSK